MYIFVLTKSLLKYYVAFITFTYIQANVLNESFKKEALHYIKIDKQGKYHGLTDQAKELIKSSRDALRKRKTLFDKEFKQFESIFHAAHVNRLIEGNMFLYGPSGGGKSKFIKWLFNQDEEKAFELQMHQMMSEQAFIGGQNFQAAQDGRFEINTQGSLADFKVALIDEIDKGNPAALAALLSLLNERQILAGNKIVKSKLETIFSTSNANLYEIYQQFMENGMKSTASALLNRFTTIAFVPNWLSRMDQTLLDYYYLDELDSLFNPELMKDKETCPLRWQELRTLAYLILRPNEEFLSLAREFCNLLRKETIQALDSHKENETEQPYYPTAEYTERLRQKILATVLMSVFLDLIASPLTDDIEDLEKKLITLPYHRFSVGPLSSWRTYLTLTCVSFGKVALLTPTESNSEIDLEFGDFFTIERYQPNDKKEESTIRYILEEQERFKRIFKQVLHEHQNEIADASSYSTILSPTNNVRTINELQDVERLLINYRALDEA